MLRKNLLLVLIFALGLMLSAPAMGITPTGSIQGDIDAVQAAVDAGGTVTLSGTFDFGLYGRVNVTTDNVSIIGEPGATIKGGWHPFLIGSTLGVANPNVKDLGEAQFGCGSFFSDEYPGSSDEVTASPVLNFSIENVLFDGPYTSAIFAVHTDGDFVVKNCSFVNGRIQDPFPWVKGGVANYGMVIPGYITMWPNGVNPWSYGTKISGVVTIEGNDFDGGTALATASDGVETPLGSGQYIKGIPAGSMSSYIAADLYVINNTFNDLWAPAVIDSNTAYETWGTYVFDPPMVSLPHISLVEGNTFNNQDIGITYRGHVMSQSAMELNGQHNLTVRNNNMLNGYAGIRTHHSINPVIEGNTVKVWGGGDFGIGVDGSSGFGLPVAVGGTVTGNTISCPTEAGQYASSHFSSMDTDNVELSNNYFTGNSNWGVNPYHWNNPGTSNNWTITGNTFENFNTNNAPLTADMGLSDSMISNNTFIDCSGVWSGGIMLWPGNGNVIHENEFINVNSLNGFGAVLPVYGGNNIIVNNDYTQSGLLGFDVGEGAVTLYYSNDNLVFESGNFTRGTGGAVNHVLDYGTNNRVVGHPAKLKFPIKTSAKRL